MSQVPLTDLEIMRLEERARLSPSARDAVHDGEQKEMILRLLVRLRETELERHLAWKATSRLRGELLASMDELRSAIKLLSSLLTDVHDPNSEVTKLHGYWANQVESGYMTLVQTNGVIEAKNRQEGAL